MSVKKKETKKDFEKQYNQLMEKSLINNLQKNQWSSPNDFFVKFSLYKETSTGKTSSGTFSIHNL